jgi:hypothetical protein
MALGALRLLTRRASTALPLSERWSHQKTERVLSTFRGPEP